MDSLSLKLPFYKLYSAYCLTLGLACNIVKTGGEITFFDMAEKSFFKNNWKKYIKFLHQKSRCLFLYHNFWVCIIDFYEVLYEYHNTRNNSQFLLSCIILSI
jgi:hypothetical protein